MEHESPIMKAWREFPLADPNDCDREWEAYLALVNKTGTASGSSPTNSTSSLAPAAATRVSPTTSVSARPRVPGNAAPIANPTAAAASRAVLSAKHDSPKDDLSPEARRIYDFLVGRSATPASAVSEISPVLQVPTVLDVAPIAADFNVSDLAAPSPATCSTGCPSSDDSASVCAIISSVTPISSTTTGHAALELAASVVCDEALPVDATCVVALPPTNCSTGCSDSEFGMSFPASVAHHAILLRPLPWPSFECSQVGTKLWYVHAREKISRFISKFMGSTSGDVTRFGDVRGWSDLSAIEGYQKVNPPVRCMVVAAPNEQDLESGCKTLVRCCPNIPDDTLVNRVSFPSLESVVKLIIFQRRFGAAVHMRFKEPLHEAQVYWLYFKLERVTVSYLQFLGSYCPTSDHHQWVLERLQFHPLLESWFQFWPVGRTFLYGYDAALYQWEIARPTTTLSHYIPSGMHLYHTLECSTVICYLQLEIASLAIHSIFLLHLHRDPSGFTRRRLRVMPKYIKEDDNQLTCKSREQCLIGGILVEVIISKEDGIFVEKYIKEEKKLVNICASATQATSWPEIQPMRQVWIVLLGDQNGGFSLEHLWDPGGLILLGWQLQQLGKIMSHTKSVSVGISEQQSIDGYVCDSFEHSFYQVMKMFASPTITCELHYSTLVVENLLAAPYSSWCMRCVKLDVEETQECVLFLQPKPPWSLLAASNSTSGFSWDISGTIDSETSIKPNSSIFSHALQYWDVGDYVLLAVLLVSSSLSQAWVLHLPVACILRRRSELMTWEIASSEDGTWTCTNRVLIPWDPGGAYPVIDAATGSNWNSTQVQDSQQIWDPGGCTQHRLEVKPNFIEGGLSATSSTCCWAD